MGIDWIVTAPAPLVASFATAMIVQSGQLPAEPAVVVDLVTKLGSFGALLWCAWRLSSWLPRYMERTEKRYDDMLVGQGARHDTLIATFKSESKAERDACEARFERVMEHHTDARDAIIEEVRRRERSA